MLTFGAGAPPNEHGVEATDSAMSQPRSTQQAHMTVGFGSAREATPADIPTTGTGEGPMDSGDSSDRQGAAPARHIRLRAEAPPPDRGTGRQIPTKAAHARGSLFGLARRLLHGLVRFGTAGGG